MKITQKQVLILWNVIKDTLKIDGVIGGMTVDQRKQWVDIIMNQQSDELLDLDN